MSYRGSSLETCANGYKYARLFNAHMADSTAQIPRDATVASELNFDSDVYEFPLLCSKIGYRDSIRVRIYM